MLVSFVSPVTGPLEDLQRQWSQFTALHRDAHTRLCSQGAALNDAGGLDSFVGDAATAFSDAIQEYIALSEQYMQILDQAINAAGRCVNEIMGAIENVFFAGVDTMLLLMVFTEITLETILQEGGDAIHRVLQDMLNSLGNAGHGILSSFGDLVTFHPLDALHDASQAVGDLAHVIGEEPILLALSVLTAFGWSLHNTVRTYLNILTSLPIPTYVPHISRVSTQTPAQSSSSPFKLKPSMGSIAQEISSLEGSKTPIAIRQVGNGQILVEIAGMDPHPGDQNNLNNVPDAINAGGGDKNDPYILAAQKAIQKFITDNNLPASTQVIVAGHSQGGIVAQYLAENNNNTSYKVVDVITFGSPQIGPDDPSVQNYFQYTTQYDAVPLLSWYEFKPLLDEYGWKGALTKVYQLNAGGTNAKELFTGEIRVPDLGNNANPSEWVNSDHNYTYPQGTQNGWLQQQPVPFNTSQIGPVTTYSAPPENPLVDTYRSISMLQRDINGSADLLPGLSNIFH